MSEKDFVAKENMQLRQMLKQMQRLPMLRAASAANLFRPVARVSVFVDAKKTKRAEIKVTDGDVATLDAAVASFCKQHKLGAAQAAVIRADLERGFSQLRGAAATAAHAVGMAAADDPPPSPPPQATAVTRAVLAPPPSRPSFSSTPWQPGDDAWDATFDSPPPPLEPAAPPPDSQGFAVFFSAVGEGDGVWSAPVDAAGPGGAANGVVANGAGGAAEESWTSFGTTDSLSGGFDDANWVDAEDADAGYFGFDRNAAESLQWAKAELEEARSELDRGRSELVRVRLDVGAAREAAATAEARAAELETQRDRYRHIARELKRASTEEGATGDGRQGVEELSRRLGEAEREKERFRLIARECKRQRDEARRVLAEASACNRRDTGPSAASVSVMVPASAVVVAPPTGQPSARAPSDAWDRSSSPGTSEPPAKAEAEALAGGQGSAASAEAERNAHGTPAAAADDDLPSQYDVSFASFFPSPEQPPPAEEEERAPGPELEASAGEDGGGEWWPGAAAGSKDEVSLFDEMAVLEE